MTNNSKTISSVQKGMEKEGNHVKQFLIILMGYIGLISFFTSFLRIALFYNSSESYNIIFYLNLGSIFIFSAGILFRPWEALFISMVGSVLGEFLYCLIFGCGESLPAYLIFMLVSSGFAGGIISVLNHKIEKGIIGEIFAIIIGILWQYIGLVITAYVYYEVIISFFNWQLYAVYIFYPLFSSLFTFFLIPISIILNEVVRRLLKIHYLDDLITINMVTNKI